MDGELPEGSPPQNEADQAPDTPPNWPAHIPPPPIDLSPEQVIVPQPPVRSTSVIKRVLVAVGAFVVVGGIGALAFAFIALRGTGDVMDQMVPAKSSVYVTAYLDPALKQKLNLRNLAKHFPDLVDSAELDRRINEALDQILDGSGLTAKDIRPWLGSQVAFAITLDGDQTKTVVLIATKDDGMARAALAKIRNGPRGQGETWKDETHDGVVVSVGFRGAVPNEAYALMDHKVLVGDQSAIHDVIDTAHGTLPNIGDSPAFIKTVAPLPSERLLLAYVNAGPLLDRLQSQAGTGGLDLGGVSGLTSSFGQLDAFTGLGATLSAQSNGVALDVAITMDPTKLTAAQQQVAGEAPHVNTMLAFTPKEAYGVVVGTALRQSVQAAVDQFSKADPAGYATFDRETGLSGVIGHLSGDYGIEVSPGLPIPGGALLVATDDESAMRTFLGKSALLAVEALGVTDSSFQHQTYRGVDIAYLSTDDLAMFGVTPAYAVTKGTAIVASSVQEVEAIVDAQADGRNVTSAANLAAAASAEDLSNNGMMYLDLEAIVRDVRRVLGPDGLARFDSSGGSNLAPLKALVLVSRSATDRGTIRMFLLIQ